MMSTLSAAIFACLLLRCSTKAMDSSNGRTRAYVGPDGVAVATTPGVHALAVEEPMVEESPSALGAKLVRREPERVPAEGPEAEPRTAAALGEALRQGVLVLLQNVSARGGVVANSPSLAQFENGQWLSIQEYVVGDWQLSLNNGKLVAATPTTIALAQVEELPRVRHEVPILGAAPGTVALYSAGQEQLISIAAQTDRSNWLNIGPYMVGEWQLYLKSGALISARQGPASGASTNAAMGGTYGATGATGATSPVTGSCNVPMWDAETYACEEWENYQMSQESWTDALGNLRIKMPPGGPCTIQCPSPRWMVPDEKDMLCQGGAWTDKQGVAVLEINCATAKWVYGVFLVSVAALVFFVYKCKYDKESSVHSWWHGQPVSAHTPEQGALRTSGVSGAVAEDEANASQQPVGQTN